MAGDRVLGLDGVRTLAIGLVLADHAAGTHFRGGGVGVAVFFVLSGYLITSLLAAERRRHGRIGLPLFYGRRALRLWPALLAMLVVTIALGASKLHALVAGVYLTDIANIFNRDVSPYGHTWSLGTEEQFYLLWPLALIWLLRRRRTTQAVAVTAAITVSILGCTFWTWHSVAATGGVGLGVFNPAWQGHGLLIGCIVALLGDRLRTPAPQVTSVATGVGIVGIAFVASWTAHDHIALVWNVAVEMMTAVLIIALLEVASGPYTWAPVVWMGQRSYAIYLWHLPLIILLAEKGVAHSVALGIILAFVAAELSFRFVEAPFLRIKDRLHPTVRKDGNDLVVATPTDSNRPAPTPFALED